MGVVGLAENKATQPSLAGAWAELGNIFKIYTKWAVGISTPLGSQEIQKTKVYTVLWDTLIWTIMEVRDLNIYNS